MRRNSKTFSKLPNSIQRFLIDARRWQYFALRRLTASHYRRKNSGRGTHVDRDSVVLGWRNVRIGANVMISEGVVINVNRRDNAIRVIIGDNSALNRDCYIGTGELVDIGAYALFGPGCRLIGANHIFETPFAPYIATGSTAEGRIVLGANCWLGAGVTVVGNVTIGHGCVVGANSMILKDIPPFSIVVGSPARVIKRFDITQGAWVAASAFTEEAERLIPSEPAYLTALSQAHPRIAMPFAASGRSMGDLA
jgi:acetyltransferase-like isoleucine patch superfamily enzyme